MNFNPRPREEGDCNAIVNTKLTFKISIHALVKRATSCVAFYTGINAISIHALVKRATVDLYNIYINAHISIHALVKRATRQAGHIVIG